MGSVITVAVAGVVGPGHEVGVSTFARSWACHQGGVCANVTVFRAESLPPTATLAGGWPGNDAVILNSVEGVANDEKLDGVPTPEQ